MGCGLLMVLNQFDGNTFLLKLCVFVHWVWKFNG